MSDKENLYQSFDTYLLAQQEVKGFMGSVLVVKGEGFVFSKCYGYANLEHNILNTPDTKFRIGSISKQFTAAAILKLQEYGLLNVIDTLSTHLPNYPHGDQITIHHLLTHTSGIPSFTSFEDFQILKKQPTTLTETVNRFKNLPLEFTPGSQFNYSNSGYMLLAYLMEHISGKSYAEFLKNEFFDPLNLANTGEEIPRQLINQRAYGYSFQDGYIHADYINMSVPTGGGSLYSTTRDLLSWYKNLQANRVINLELTKKMLNPQFIMNEATSDGYGYGLFTGEFEGSAMVGHDGGIEGFVSSAWYFPNENTYIIALSNVDTVSMQQINFDLTQLIFGKEVSLPVKKVAISLDPSILQQYVGSYELKPGFILSIRLIENRLIGQATGQDEFDLFAFSPTVFFTAFNAEATFVLEDEKVKHLVWHQGKSTIAPKVL